MGERNGISSHRRVSSITFLLLRRGVPGKRHQGALKSFHLTINPGQYQGHDQSGIVGKTGIKLQHSCLEHPVAHCQHMIAAGNVECGGIGHDVGQFLR